MTAVDQEKQVGRQTFNDMIKLLTKRGETKAGLSTYYIRMRYASNLFVSMMKRVCNLDSSVNNKDEIQCKDEELIHEWKIHEQFIMWDYPTNHLSLQSEDIAHCCRCALGGYCDESHPENSCPRCSKLVTFFDTKVCEYLHIVMNNLDDKSEESEIKSMLCAVPKFGFMLKHYIAHRLRAKVQFHAIDIVKESMKNSNGSQILIVMDHKQKVQSMKYREGQVEYYGKKGMSVMGVMLVQWMENDDGKKGFKYSFVDYIVKGYSGQDNVQVAALIQEISSLVRNKFTAVKQICLQSDNATCFASQEMIPFIHHLNAENNTTRIVKWIFTEAQTGHGRIDTHFSYVNIVLKSYVEDGNDIDLEDDIFKALSYQGGLAGTTVVLFDGRQLSGKALKKTFNCNTIGSRETHEIRWISDKAEIIKSSGITDPITVPIGRLEKYQRNHLNVSIEKEFTSEKPSLFINASTPKHMNAVDTNISSKAQTYVSALTCAGVYDCSSSHLKESCELDVQTPEVFLSDWATYPGNTTDKISKPVLHALRELYQLGASDKKRKVSADRALQILFDGILLDNWEEKMVVTVPRIKAFFSITPAKQKSLLMQKKGSNEDDEFNTSVQVLEEHEVHKECMDTANSLEDIN